MTIPEEVIVERGSSLEDLCRAKEPDTFSFVHKNLLWDVKYRASDWKVRCNAIETSYKSRQVMDENLQSVSEVYFATAQYYETMLMHVLIDINGEKVTLPLLRTFDKTVITNLITVIPAPNLMMDLIDSKKELESSEVESLES